MNTFLNLDTNYKTLSPLTLAYIGDGVYETFVREYLISKGNQPVNTLHKAAVEFVRCEFQSFIIKELLDEILTSEEKTVYTRGRNAKVPHVPKNSNIADYHAATGFECLFGYLYLKGELERLKEFFTIITLYKENN
ncbi:MAG: ribonuclease III domain-containing protein [Clostridia bacterium]